MHSRDNIKAGATSADTLSQGVKILKYKYLLAAINQHSTDQVGFATCHDDESTGSLQSCQRQG